MKLVSVAEMKAIEKEANRRGTSFEEMMQRAGEGLADVIEEQYPALKTSPAVGLVGGGNNGGDTLIALTTLQKAGWLTTAVLAKERTHDPLVTRYVEAGGKVITTEEKKDAAGIVEVVREAELVLDGVVGTGIALPLRTEIASFLELVKENLDHQTVLAVDCPSGVDCDSGETAPATLQAELTVCFEAVKVGLLRFPAFACCGEIMTIPIGLESSMAPEHMMRCVIDEDWVSKNLPARAINAHKGTFGTVMVVGGSVNYVGAPMLSALAAYRSGSGLVSLAVPQSIHPMLAGQIPEAVWLVLSDEGGVISESAADLVKEQLARVSAMVIGPGIGREETTTRFLDALFFSMKTNNKNRRVGFLVEENASETQDQKMPAIVLDADGLRWLANREGWNEKLQASLVLTPHPGEMASLTGLTVEEIQSERLGIAALYAKKWDQVIVLKGALTVIAAPDGRTAVIPVASSALAKAGSGDVLSGIIASLIGQGMERFKAASAAAWIHAQAGLAAAEWLGSDAAVLATDIIQSIADVLAGLK
jgi:ADP-dependent NAD(P)H-hydrate dehydratase / NAD(P)H-hydrate epimerase